MKTIIAEKPSVAKEIAHIVGADKREEGYMQGNGYYVTWAFGHLVQPAMPETYGMKGFHAENLPVIPDPFVLVPRQVKTENGYKPDAGVLAQIKIIGKLFDSSERIIVATDAGREGELIFRYLYAYLGCRKPFDRLWISSLTDTAIREGLQNLTDGKEYDNLYHAAKARSEADWLVGINGTQALTIAAGRGTYSVGRVQTPTLGMVCERYWEHKHFESKPFWQVHFGVVDADSGNILKFTSVNRWTDKATATDIYNKVKETGSVIITKVATKRKVEKAPLLYDLTTLQKEANSQHGFTAEHTLSIAQKLYEAKFITYPRTSSRYISDDVFATLPKLFKNLENHSEYGEKVKLLPGSEDYSKNCVNAAKVTDHHALLITENAAIGLFKDEKIVYDMILCRMIEAFSADCVKDITSVSAQVDHEVEFGISGSIIRQTGWRALSLKEKNNRQDKDVEATDNEVKEQVIPNWQEGQHITFSGCTITEGKTRTLNGFTSRQGKSFSAAIAFDENFNTKFVFAEHKTEKARKCEEIQEIVCTFATETWFINGVLIQDAFIYCGLSGGTRRDTECLFSVLNYHYQVNVYQNMINSHLYLLPLHTNFIYNMMDSSINRIRVVLAEQNKTNRWLAEQMGKSEITISRWVQNKSQPSLEQLLQVAKLLSISPKDLINDINNSEAENV